MWDALVGDAWVRHAAVIDAHSAPFGEAAMNELGDLHEATVLDVGCGTGSTSLALARRGAAQVIGVDLSGRMITEARRTAADAGMGEVRFEVADVNGLTSAVRFDSIYSRFGVMFFDDPVATFAHLRGLVRGGGRLGFAAWRDPFSNPWMLEAMIASIPVIGPPNLPGPGEPGPFSLATADRVEEVLGAAGWNDLTVGELTVEQPHPAGDAAQVAEVLVSNIPPLAAAAADRPEIADELRAAVADALRPHEREGEVHLSASALIVSARA